MNQVEIKKRRVEFCSFVLEMVVLLVLGELLGDNGVVYIAFSLESFMLLWTIAGRGMADALGKLLRGRSARRQYKNAARMRKNALIFAALLGLAGSVALFACAELLGEDLLRLHYCTAIIRRLAPVIFLRSMTAVLLGYFQGEGTGLPAVISYVIRPVCVLGFSLLFIKIFGDDGKKVSALLRQENYTAMYGGMGVAYAVLVSEVLVLLFLFLVYRGSRGKERKGNADGMRTVDSFVGQLRMLYGNLLPQMGMALLRQLPVWLGIYFFRNSVVNEAGLNDYGILYGKYLPLTGMMVFSACALLMGNCCRTADCVRREEQRYARGYFCGGLHMGAIYGMFFTVFTAIMAPRLAEIFCVNGAGLAAQLLRFGSIVVLFSAAGFYLSEILILLGGKFQVLGALALYNLVYVICLLVFLNGGKMGVIALIYAGAVAGGVYTAATGILLFYQLRLNVDWLQAAAVPAGGACVAGLLMFLAGRLLTPLGNIMTVLLCLVLGLVSYILLLLLLRNFREQELNYIPFGGLIRSLGQTLHIY